MNIFENILQKCFQSFHLWQDMSSFFDEKSMHQCNETNTCDYFELSLQFIKEHTKVYITLIQGTVLLQL